MWPLIFLPLANVIVSFCSKNNLIAEIDVDEEYAYSVSGCSFHFICDPRYTLTLHDFVAHHRHRKLLNELISIFRDAGKNYFAIYNLPVRFTCELDFLTGLAKIKGNRFKIKCI